MNLTRPLLVMFVVLLAGCAPVGAPRANPAASPAAPPVESATAPGPAQPAATPLNPAQPAAPAPAEPVRAEIPGGFRIGPFGSAVLLGWDGPDRVRVIVGQTVGTVSLAGGLVEPIASITQPIMMDPWHQHLSPDGTRAVTYGKAGPGRFTDLTTGAGHELAAPGFYGSNMFDSWAPDGSLYLVQSVRKDAAPGFYFMGRDGQPVAQFAEAGRYNHRGAWSPDSRRVAFLSVPLETEYPHTPEEWDEPPFGPEVGILDVGTGKARRIVMGQGQAAFGFPVWAPDSRQFAVTYGDLLVADYDFGSATTIRNSRICLIDAATGSVWRIGGGEVSEDILSPISWAPDGSALLIDTLRDRTADLGQSVLPTDGGKAVPLPGWAVWLDGNRLALSPDRGALALQVVDRTGAVIGSLDTGAPVDGIRLSPDGRHLVYTEVRGAGQYYIVVVATQS